MMKYTVTRLFSVLMIFFSINTSSLYGMDGNTDFSKALGFDRVDQKITGEGVPIALFQEFESIHAHVRPPEFSEPYVNLSDSSHDHILLPNCINISPFRYPFSDFSDSLPVSVTSCPPLHPPFSYSKDVQRVAVARSLAPQSNLRIYRTCTVAAYELLGTSPYGTAVYSYNEFCDKKKAEPWENQRKNLQRLPSEALERLERSPVNDSLLVALEHATQTRKTVLNLCRFFPELTDPYNGFAIPPSIVDMITKWVIDSDAILVLPRGHSFERGKYNRPLHSYHNSLTRYPLCEHVLIVGSVKQEEVSLAHDRVSEGHTRIDGVEVTLPSGKKARITPSSDTTFPIERSWGSAVVTAFGEDLHFPETVFPSDSAGLSLATIIVSGLCALMREKYPKMTGLQIVKRVKATTIKDGLDAQYFGHGLIHPLRALDMEDVM